MAVPKKKISVSRRGNRRAHDRLGTVHVQEDQHTGEYVLPHHVCRKTGMYKGEQIIEE